MKRKYRMISFLMTVILLSSILPLPATPFLSSASAIKKAEASSAVENAVKEYSKKLGYKDVTSLFDVSKLFEDYYNPDIVKANGLDTEKNYTLIVQLEGYSMIQFWELEGKQGNFSDYLSSESGTAHRLKIQKDIEEYLATLDSLCIDYRLCWKYDTLIKGLSLTVRGKDANTVASAGSAAVTTVSSSYSVPKVIEIENDANVYATGIYDTSAIDQSLRGQGTFIAILDTGLDYTHAAFQEDNFAADRSGLAFTYDQLVDVFSAFELTAEQTTEGLKPEDVYISVKIPYAYDYADKDPDVYSSYSSHGTHVAGITAGNHTVIDGNSIWLDPAKELTFVQILDQNGKPTGEYLYEGVAPDAQLAIMKVFTDDVDREDLGGADTEDILRALDDCAKIGVDVINMSLGTGAGFSSYADDLETIVMSEVYNALYTAGISLICAASNDYSSGYGGETGTNLTSNPDSATVGSPSTYPAAMSVASISGKKSKYFLGNEKTMVFFTESNDGNSNKRDFMKQIFEAAGKNKDTDELAVKYVVIGGVGRAYNYTVAKSKIESLKEQGYLVMALVARGDTTFEEKMVCAMEAGCDGIIIRNNVAGGISMTMGKTNEADMIPAVSISMDIGKELADSAENGVGTLVLNNSFEAGPFMSDFSSWGPTPSLMLKPELTSYGGEVTSAVSGGYDVYSGTSMAAPNMAGAVAIIRTYLKKLNPNYTDVELSRMCYQLMMSTANLVLNEYGDPYSPRKQGAGLTDIDAVLATSAYAWVEDKNGKPSDKTKIELYDDPSRTGIYTMTYYVTNFGKTAVSYVLDQYVMTETVSSDGLTVAERSYLFDDYKAEYTVSPYGSADSVAYRNSQKTVIIDAGSTAKISLTLTLSDEDKAYLESNFKNGMYVEGFLTLKGASDETKVDISIPYLAFYGDWTDAPMLDYSCYEIADIEQDDSIPDDDKDKIVFYATTPFTKYGEKYILPMGQYLYTMSDDMTKIYADTDKAAVSMYNAEGHETAYEFYAIYAGLLRGAAIVNVRVTDYYTGNTVYEDTLKNVAKGYAGGGATRPGYIPVEFNPYEAGLPNNGKYLFEMEGYLDYGDGKQGHKNSFSFIFTTDYETPELVDTSVRFVTQTVDDKEVTRIYLDVTTFDNQYAQAILLCYINDKENALELATEYVTPIYSSSKGVSVTTTIEITDIYKDYFSNLYLQIEDYAMNYKVYELDLTEAITFPDKISFERSEITLKQNESCKPAIVVSSELENYQTYDLNWISRNEKIAKVKDGEIIGISEGETYVYVYLSRDASLGIPYARIKVKVTDEVQKITTPLKSLSFGLILNDKYQPVNPTNKTVDVHPNTDIQLEIVKDPWYAPDFSYKWSSSNELVATVDQNGLVHTIKEGTATIVAEYDIYTVYVRLNVGKEFIITNYVLTDYFGPGGDVVVPDEYNFMSIDEEVFMDNDTITSFVIPDGVNEISKNAFKNCKNLKKIVLPDTVNYIHESAFEGCTALEEIDMSDSLSVIAGKRAFYGCSALKTIKTDSRGCRFTAVWDFAFCGCTALEYYDARYLGIVGEYAFADCVALKNVDTSEYTTIGKGMFNNCASLTSLTLSVKKIAPYAFSGCSSLKQVTLTCDNMQIGESAFDGCTKLITVDFKGKNYDIGKKAFSACNSLTVITLPDSEVTIGENAFRNCVSLARIRLNQNTEIIWNGSSPFAGCKLLKNLVAVKPVGGELTVVSSGTTSKYKIVDNCLYSADGKALLFVPSGVDCSSYIIPSGVTKIGSNAFNGHTDLKAIDLSGITEIGSYAFSATGIAGKVVIPSTVKNIGAGAFFNCKFITSVEFQKSSGITYIPESFLEACTKLNAVSLPSGIKYIGDNAFAVSGLKTLTVAGESSVSEGILDLTSLKRLTDIGNGAFSETHFVSVTLPKTLKTVGSAAFAYCPKLREVSFENGVSDLLLGDALFYDSNSLMKVIFPEGLTYLPAFTFASKTERGNLREVHLPKTLKSIGQNCFYECIALESVNLGDTAVTEIADFVFYGCDALKDIDLSKIVVFGTASFAFNAGMKELSLNSAKVIADRAFYGVSAEKVIFPKLEELGTEAFMESAIKEVTLPNTVVSIGKGALSFCKSLKGISMPKASENYFVDNFKDEFGTDLGYGVLYSKLPNGSYQLESFPAGAKISCYTVLNGTVRIGEEAFEGTVGLDEVVVSATVKVIGSKAFYNAKIASYRFTGVTAPVLECMFIDGEEYDTDTWLYQAFSRNGGQGSEQYYANFYYYSAYAALANEDYGLLLYCPVNGYGYGSEIWNDFFRGYTTIDEVPDETTLSAIEMISELLSESEIQKLNEEAFKGYCPTVISARRMFNAVLSGVQSGYIHGDYDGTNYEEILLSAEAVMRSLKEKYRIDNPILRIDIRTAPDKTEYLDRELFDITGIAVIAYYKDESERVLENNEFTLSKRIAAVGNKYLTVKYGDLTSSIAVTVLENPSVCGEAKKETVDLIQSIFLLPSALEIAQMTDTAFIELAETVKNLRISYIALDSDQKALVSGEYNHVDYLEILSLAESTIRSERSKRNLPLAMKEIVIENTPNKTVYNPGEKVSTEGMLVYAVYEDGSVEEIRDYRIVPETVEANMTSFEVEYNGFKVTVEIQVNLKENASSDESSDVLTTVLIAISASVLILGIAAVSAGMIITKKKKSKENSEIKD